LRVAGLAALQQVFLQKGVIFGWRIAHDFAICTFHARR
jgi:hypothetical protein